jgi:hypothetical protein
MDDTAEAEAAQSAAREREGALCYRPFRLLLRALRACGCEDDMLQRKHISMVRKKLVDLAFEEHLFDTASEALHAYVDRILGHVGHLFQPQYVSVVAVAPISEDAAKIEDRHKAQIRLMGTYKVPAEWRQTQHDDFGAPTVIRRMITSFSDKLDKSLVVVKNGWKDRSHSKYAHR